MTTKNYDPKRVRVTLYHTNMGQARFRVTYMGRNKYVPMAWSSRDPFLTAMLEVLGNSVKVNDSDRNHRSNKVVVFYIA